MTRSLSRLQAALVGFFVLAATAGAGFGLFAVGDRQRLWSESFTVHVGFDTVQGVGVGTPVRVRGLEAGAVEAIDLPGPGQSQAPLLLKLRLDRRYAHLLFADATARVRAEGMVGGKVVELEPGSPDRGSLADGAVIAAKPAPDLNDVIDQAAALVEDVKSGRGSLGKLLKDDKVYNDVAGTLEQTKLLMQRSQDAVSAIQQDADALKKLPIVRGYVEDTTALLVRHSGQRHRHVFAADELFEPGRAALTEDGKGRLWGLQETLTSTRVSGSDIVVAAFADPKADLNPQVAHTLTVRQGEAVAEYLKNTLNAHKTGWFARRDVKAIGLGTRPAPVAEEGSQPGNRVEVLVFTP
jgi:phospholipid/cholesterol/gamma-HCH transport system substrate-binding protein